MQSRALQLKVWLRSVTTVTLGGGAACTVTSCSDEHAPSATQQRQRRASRDFIVLRITDPGSTCSGRIEMAERDARCEPSPRWKRQSQTWQVRYLRSRYHHYEILARQPTPIQLALGHHSEVRPIVPHRCHGLHQVFELSLVVEAAISGSKCNLDRYLSIVFVNDPLSRRAAAEASPPKHPARTCALSRWPLQEKRDSAHDLPHRGRSSRAIPRRYSLHLRPR